MGFLQTFAQYYSDSSYYSSSTLSPTDTAAAAAVLAFFLLFTLIAAVIGYVVLAVCLMRIFKKAGVKQWIAWVPIYNSWKTLEIGGQQGFWAVLAIIPVINVVAAILLYISMYNIGLKLNKSGAFVLLAIFLPFVWYIWLAVDKSTWDETKGAPRLDEPEVAPQAPAAEAPTDTTPPVAPVA